MSESKSQMKRRNVLEGRDITDGLSEKKFREFWIKESGFSFGSDVCDSDPCVDDYIHVIEYSAYQALKAEVERLKSVAAGSGNKTEALQSKCAIYEAAIENISGQEKFYSIPEELPAFKACAELARQAILTASKIGEAK